VTSRALRPTGQAAAETELLAQLGLPASASPEDVDQLHQAVSEFLAAAPAEVRGWARAQVAALDSTYIALTDPAGLEGSALKSPARPPVVVPGGPATPPARRGPAPADVPVETVEALEADDELDIDGEPDVEDLAALYAMVTPSAHADMLPDARRQKAKAQPRGPQAQPAAGPRPAVRPAVAAAPAPGGTNVWKAIVLAAASLGVVAVLVVGGIWVFNRGAVAAPGASAGAQASSDAPVVDMAKVGELMQKLQANPKDIDSLLALGTEYYAGGDMQTAGTWFDKVLAINPSHIDALLARGAVYFNLQDLANAEATWKKVAVLEPDNIEVHYDLGFLYLNQPSPNWDGVKAEWNKVVALDPTSDLAKTVKSHLASLESASMLPGSSAGASAAPAASAAPGASVGPGASAPAVSAAPGASAAPAASPQAGTPVVVQLAALNLAYSTTTLAAPAGAPFTIRFQNQDVGLPHNVEIKDASGTSVFKGDIVTGATTVDYQVPALPAGSYTFTCSVHPNMTGTLTVGS
jgi:tetratricopeptide (TPR) repeat protein